MSGSMVSAGLLPVFVKEGLQEHWHAHLLPYSLLSTLVLQQM